MLIRGPTSANSTLWYPVLTNTWCRTSIVSSMFLKVTTLLPSFVLFVTASRGGKICCKIFTMRFPRRDVNPSKMRCGYDSLTVPRELFGISWRNTTLCNENEIVGPWGKCDSVMAVGVPRCSWSRIMSESPEAWADWIRFPKTKFPLFRRMDVGRSNLISLAKDDRREEGSLEVVTRTRGSTIPDSCAYSSSKSSSSFAVKSARDSSYL